MQQPSPSRPPPPNSALLLRLPLTALLSLPVVFPLPAAAQPPGFYASSEFSVGAYPTARQNDPEISFSPSGDFVVVWVCPANCQGNSLSPHLVSADLYASTGQLLRGNFQVNSYSTDNTTFYSSVSHARDGSFVIVWANVESSLPTIRGRRFDSLGSPLASEFQVAGAAGTPGWPAVSHGPTGEFVVVWQLENPDSIWARLYDSTGNSSGTEFQVSTSPSYLTHKLQPVIDHDPTGQRFTVLWSQTPQTRGDSDTVRARHFTPAGAPFAPDFQVNSSSFDVQSYYGQPDLDHADDGTFLVTWPSTGNDGDGGAILVRQFDSAGLPVGTEYIVNSYTTGDQVWPRVTQVPDGAAIITWHNLSLGPDPDTIRARRYAGSLIAAQPEFIVNTYSTTLVRHPSVAGGPDGSFVVVWERYFPHEFDFTLSYWRVAAKRFELALFADDFESGDLSQWQ